MQSITLIASLSVLAGTALGAGGRCCPPPAQPDEQVLQAVFGADAHPHHQPAVEVVFVLDTTGSMGGLIEGAKQKIWSIATHIAQAQEAPTIRMGLVGYRDRGDAYITKRTQLTEDLDALYSDLTGFQAQGGGDTPESVNQALFEAVERFDWSEEPGTLRIIYLVGDAPPKMNYDDDVKYRASCALATEAGILVNTIQCGGIQGTREIWQEIAQHAGGAFAAIPQDGGVQAIATPYDDELRSLDQELQSLMLDYGDREVLERQSAKRTAADQISETAAPEAAADRALYNQTAGGRSNLFGLQELVNDYAEGKVKLEEIERDHLPESLRDMTVEEMEAIVVANDSRRKEIRSRMLELGNARTAYQSSATAELPADSFDRQVLESLQKQGAAKGLTIGKRVSEPVSEAIDEPEAD